MVQWVRLGPPNAGNTGSIPGQGTRSHKPQLRPTTGKIKQTNNPKKTRFLYCNEQLYFLMSWGSNSTGCSAHFHAGCFFPFIILWKFCTAFVCPSERFCVCFFRLPKGYYQPGDFCLYLKINLYKFQKFYRAIAKTVSSNSLMVPFFF